MPEGVIKWFDSSKGYGLILPDNGGKDVIVKAAALVGFDTPPSAGVRVRYELIDPRRGTEAALVRPA